MASLQHGIALLLVATGLGSCSAASQVRDGVGAAVTAPLDDFNLRREFIPTVLLQAEGNPYDTRNLNQCTTIAAEVIRLNDALGPDTDEPPHDDGTRLSERAQDAAARAALDAIRNSVTDFIPGRNWIRRLSGADQHSRSVQSAIQAGRSRRAYLKGLGMQRNCAPPASPSWYRPRSAAYAQ
ncbi:hypothetical protein [Brevundimonas subvibrioides]|uniref:Uncharacterized protein n=1 Tax=Brevundimonas subvibrioides (strain ATCC 15264 / DSM 4735 / LMG 14903 / NBRC 16000 / CB 81) TaxID=633149 RepID=D9QGA6_BRESC|nr:hypothetical protein [Brevundimonas subvibrioides]ADL00722.1 conserved hypothetical protein [Brevundimonas subvibrioides ATCC 15264]